MGIILTFIFAMIAVVAGMVILPAINGFIGLFRKDDDENEEES